jgi:hypothetical protein
MRISDILGLVIMRKIVKRFSEVMVLSWHWRTISLEVRHWMLDVVDGLIVGVISE